MRLLQENPHMSQRELARAVGISAGGAHYLLKSLVEKGFVKLGNFSKSAEKGRYVYILTPAGLAEKSRTTRAFLERKMVEYEALRAEIAELEAEVEAGSQVQ